ncbi:sensor histidine kinase [Pontimonas salivibrio]|uniref:Sensor histidine kinase n=1 Tax=Pontimonas salivibrio TaxID=1159327 RepID=A0A2L2BQ39_9MICO|nr:sensor histidine kinase [Pontimonas salivibrio]
MRGLASYLSLLGGRGGMTPAGIALVVTITFSLTMLSGWGPYANPQYEGHFLPTLLGHAAMGAVALLLWWLLFFLPVKPPPALITTSVFVLLAVVRIYAVDYAYLLVGVPTVPLSPSRFALSIVFVVPLFALTGVLVELLQRSRVARRRIDQAQESIVSLGLADRGDDAPTVAEVMARAQAHIDQLLLPWKVSPPTRPDYVALEIDALVEEVIRPLSHETKRDLEHAVVTEAPPHGSLSSEAQKELADDPDTIFPKDLRWREILPTRGASLLLVSLPIVAVFMWERFGWSTETLIAVSTLPVLGGAFWLLRVIVTRLQPRTAVVRFAWIVAGLSAAGTTTTTLMVVAARALGTPVGFVFAAPTMLAIMGTGFSVAEHLIKVTLRREDIQAKTLSGLATRTAQHHVGTRDGMATVADVLHSGVQAELVAWAALFRTPDFVPDELPEALEEMGRRLDTFFDDQDTREFLPTQARFESLITVWSAARPIDHSVDPQVWRLLDGEPALADRVFMVFSEALSNAVRHGRPGSITLNITRPDPERVLMSVSNPGVLHRMVPSAGGGIGLSTIEAHSSGTQLEQQGGRVVLSVGFTAQSSPDQRTTEWPLRGHTQPEENRGGDDGNRTRTISLED